MRLPFEGSFHSRAICNRRNTVIKIPRTSNFFGKIPIDKTAHRSQKSHCPNVSAKIKKSFKKSKAILGFQSVFPRKQVLLRHSGKTAWDFEFWNLVFFMEFRKLKETIRPHKTSRKLGRRNEWSDRAAIFRTGTKCELIKTRRSAVRNSLPLPA